MNKLFYLLLLFTFTVSCKQVNEKFCNDAACAKSGDLKCTLSSDEMLERKEKVIKVLKASVIDKKELPDGYAFAFKGGDKTVDELVNMMKLERKCCSFMVFNLKVQGEDKPVWLEITGPASIKQFLKYELEL